MLHPMVPPSATNNIGGDKLGDVRRPPARLNLTAKIDGVAQFPIFLQDNAVDRRTDDALVHIEFGVIDCRLITFKFGLPNSCGGGYSFQFTLPDSRTLGNLNPPG